MAGTVCMESKRTIKRELICVESRRTMKKELTVLAKDFGLIHIPGVKELIETATDYHKAQRRLMAIYNQTY